ncbi:MAG TPA: hypothetical protein VH165_05215 [Kofleriaceae bacterium]|jgi:hypothetical protein|nr:hypothetical protein [Kofleriaceae bacterium]
MRTGIYICSSTSVTISSSESLVMTSYTDHELDIDVSPWTDTMTPGIYRLVTDSAITVSGSGITVVASPNNKDPWPDPPPIVTETLGVSNTDVTDFFAIDLKSADF